MRGHGRDPSIDDQRRPAAPVPARALRRSRELRRDTTDAERAMWRALRGRRFEGARFTRRYAVGPYIVDFTCRRASLVVEIDGGKHAEDGAATADAARTAYLERNGHRVPRFWNADALANLDGVPTVLGAALRDAGETPRP